MAAIVLATVNAKYAHTAFGLRYLLANLGPLAAHAEICEFHSKQRPIDMVETLLARDPRIIGLGVYIWNAYLSLQLVRLLKSLRPQTTIILGGPEISHETAQQEITQHADYVICGEGEVSFRQLCEQLLVGDAPSQKVIQGALPSVTTMALPYGLYTAADVAHRVLYVEASRGCPYTCEFCLSSLDKQVRRFDLEVFLQHMQGLLDRGARQFKFIDRTFNLQLAVSQAILAFFLERYTPGLFLHFEMVPDRLPDELRALICQFPAGALQFEIGIQTLNEAVEKRISRRQNHQRMLHNLRFLRQHTGVHVHADLIVGLPGETLDSFAQGFDQLFALGPQEIQVGMLKRLRGTPIVRHTLAYGQVYSPEAPYEILQNNVLSFSTVQRMKRFAAFWDKIINSGQFPKTAPLLWDQSVFWGFLRLSDWLYGNLGQTHAIALDRLAQLLQQYLQSVRQLPEEMVRAHLLADYHRGAQRRTPAFLLEPQAKKPQGGAVKTRPMLPKRQTRHLDGAV